MTSADRGRPAFASGGRRDLYAATRRRVQVFVYGSVEGAWVAEGFAGPSLKHSKVDPISGNFPRARDTHDTFATLTGNKRNQAEKFFTGRSHAVHKIRDFPRCLVISN
jgi:hypothetical protein